MNDRSRIGRIARDRKTGDEMLKAIEAKKQARLKRPELRVSYEEPRSALEKHLAARCRETFGFDRVGIRDNFFDLGVDSFKAAMFLNRLQKEMGEFVYVTALFDAPTIADLADYLTKQYPAAVERLCGAATAGEGKECTPGSARRP